MTRNEMQEYGDFLVEMNINGTTHNDSFNGECLMGVLMRMADWGVESGSIIGPDVQVHTFEVSVNDGCIVLDDDLKFYITKNGGLV